MVSRGRVGGLIKTWVSCGRYSEGEKLVTFEARMRIVTSLSNLQQRFLFLSSNNIHGFTTLPRLKQYALVLHVPLPVAPS